MAYTLSQAIAIGYKTDKSLSLVYVTI